MDKVLQKRISDFKKGKADLLDGLSRSCVTGRSQEDSELYAVLPPLETFLEIPGHLRKQHFYDCLQKGDIVIGFVSGIQDNGLIINLLCLDQGKARDIDELKITAFCPLHEIPKFYSHEDPLEHYDMKDKVRGIVLSVSPQKEVIMLSFQQRTLPSHLHSVKLGLISDEELPEHFRHLQECDSLHYNQYLENLVGFANPSNVAILTRTLGLSEHLMSFTKGLHSLSIDKSEYADELRKKQSYRYAMKSVAEGINHFKRGKQVEAMQYLNKALQIDADNVEALVARGALFANNESYVKAIEDFEEALRLDPEHINATKYMCETLIAHGRRLVEQNMAREAIEYLQRALDMNTDLLEAQMLLKLAQEKTEKNLTPDSSHVVLSEDKNVEISTMKPVHASQLTETKEILRKIIEEEKRERSARKLKSMNKVKDRKRNSSSESSSSSDSSSLSSSSSSSDSSSSSSSSSSDSSLAKSKKHKFKRQISRDSLPKSYRTRNISEDKSPKQERYPGRQSLERTSHGKKSRRQSSPQRTSHQYRHYDNSPESRIDHNESCSAWGGSQDKWDSINGRSSRQCKDNHEKSSETGHRHVSDRKKIDKYNERNKDYRRHSDRSTEKYKKENSRSEERHVTSSRKSDDKHSSRSERTVERSSEYHCTLERRHSEYHCTSERRHDRRNVTSHSEDQIKSSLHRTRSDNKYYSSVDGDKEAMTDLQFRTRSDKVSPRSPRSQGHRTKSEKHISSKHHCKREYSVLSEDEVEGKKSKSKSYKSHGSDRSVEDERLWKSPQTNIIDLTVEGQKCSSKEKTNLWKNDWKELSQSKWDDVGLDVGGGCGSSRSKWKTFAGSSDDLVVFKEHSIEQYTEDNKSQPTHDKKRKHKETSKKERKKRSKTKKKHSSPLCDSSDAEYHDVRRRDSTDRKRDGTDRKRDGTDRKRDGTDRKRDGTDRKRDGTDRYGEYNQSIRVPIKSDRSKQDDVDTITTDEKRLVTQLLSEPVETDSLAEMENFLAMLKEKKKQQATAQKSA